MSTAVGATHPRIDWLVVGGSIDPWTRLGLVADDGRIPLNGTGIEVTGDGPPGMRGWAVSGCTVPAEVDGIPTMAASPAVATPPEHTLGATTLDHVVVNTDDLLRTCDAVADTFDAPLKRVRELGSVRQGFHRVGPSRADSLIVEVVERPDAPAGVASLWGLVLIVGDIDAACSALGDVAGEAKDAVQPGRRIATIRRDAGLGVPVALMSPEPRRDG